MEIAITDWLMVIITAVYVVATIFICRANIKAAKATQEQVTEMTRQYEEEHRAYISYEMIFERRSFYGMRFTNHGRIVAKNVKILFKQEFIDSLPDNTSYRSNLTLLKQKELILGIGQSYDIFFGASDFRDIPNKLPIEGEVRYSDTKTTYSEPILVDFDNYATFFSVNSEVEDLITALKEQNKLLQSMNNELQQINIQMAASQSTEK